MGKGTPSFGKHNKGPSHRRCRRCGNHSYLKNKRVCSSCGYGRTKKWRTYRWANKARAANGFPKRNIRAERKERAERRA